LGDAVLTQARWRGAARAVELQLARAGWTGSPVVVGPCLSEVGFELMYWIPFVRRLTERFGLHPEQVTVVSRGGVAAWYDDIAACYIDVLDVFDADEYEVRLTRRRAEAGDRKQLSIARFDREILDRTGGRQCPTIVHPSLMFLRLRYYWSGERREAALERRTRFRMFSHEAITALPPPDAAPECYIAFKAYFSDCFPDTGDNRAVLGLMIEHLAEAGDVVVLSAPRGLDDHHDWEPPSGDRIHRAAAWLTARDNLAVQSALIARAESLYCTYGGFASLAPLLGVDAVTFYSTPNHNRVHLGVARRMARDVGRSAFTVTDVRGGKVPLPAGVAACP